MELKFLKYNTAYPLAYITLNRPEKRNAFSYDLVTELKYAFQEAQDDQQVKIVILKAEGSVFCAGADLDYLQKLQNASYEENLADSVYLKDLYAQIYNFPKVVIAAVQGHALAGGCGLITVCDFVFSVPEAKFGYTEVKIGFVPAIVMTFLLRKIGESRAKSLLITGNLITAEKAVNYGLVNDTVPAERLYEFVEQFALSLCSQNSAQAMGSTKQMVATIQSLELTEALQYAAEANATARGTTDCKRGIAAFLNKEQIVW
jgi:methylglutaconyl-CoA hydratase